MYFSGVSCQLFSHAKFLSCCIPIIS
uniref:Uncharacterized protein n=1 Tax=Anguilla anguilla TaxID=7936 RepID=A0A0E9QI44_ANGAN